MNITKIDRSTLFWILHISGWVVFAISMQAYNPSGYFQSGKGFLLFFITYFTGFVLTLGLRYFYRFVYTRIKSVFGILLIVLLASLVVNTIWEPIDSLISSPFWSSEQLAYHLDRYKSLTIISYYQNNLIWFLFVLMWSVLYFGINSWFHQFDERIRAERAIALANQAQLKMLRYQLNPHFLFNSLNSIQGLMYQDVGKADLMLTELSEFLRYTLKFNSKVFIPLKDEFEIVEKYLNIEKIRFSDKLIFKITLQKGLENCQIIGLLIQPFVENAIKHGMKSNPFEKMSIIVKAFKEDDWLYVIVQNTGRWIESGDSYGTGISNARERLVNAYSTNCSLTVTHSETLVKVEIKIPCRE
jgi:sensor histidine kinase YesM